MSPLDYAKGLGKVALLFASLPFILIAGNLYLLFLLLKGAYAISSAILLGSIHPRRHDSH